MEDLELKVYKDEKTFFSKIASVFFKNSKEEKNYGIEYKAIKSKRNNAIKKYKVYLNNEEKISKFESAYLNYLEAINDYIMNKIYKRVKMELGTEYEFNMLSRYYLVLKLKDKEYYEYKYKKQIYLLTEDYKSLKCIQKASREYKEMYFKILEDSYRNLLNYYNEKYLETKDIDYINKIEDVIFQFLSNSSNKYKADKNVEDYLNFVSENNTFKIKNIQKKLINEYFKEDLNEEVKKIFNKKIILLKNVAKDKKYKIIKNKAFKPKEK